jgi:hypothetical protein
MSTTATETIKGQQYRLVKLPPLQGGRVALRVAQLLAGVLADAQAAGQLFGAATVQEGAAKILTDNAGLVAALAGSVGKVDADALYSLALECIKPGLFTEHGKLADEHAINAHFAERPEALLLVLAWALRVNCAGFFGFRAPA